MEPQVVIRMIVGGATSSYKTVGGAISIYKTVGGAISSYIIR